MQKLVKTIPDAPKDEVPIHLRDRHIFAVHPFSQGTPWIDPEAKTKMEAEQLKKKFGAFNEARTQQ